MLAEGPQEALLMTSYIVMFITINKTINVPILVMGHVLFSFSQLLIGTSLDHIQTATSHSPSCLLGLFLAVMFP